MAVHKHREILRYRRYLKDSHDYVIVCDSCICGAFRSMRSYEIESPWITTEVQEEKIEG